MKIGFLIQNFSRGHGSERVTALVSSYLAEHNHEVSIISVCGNNTSFYDINDRIQLYTLIHKTEVDNKKELFHVIREYKNLLKKISPQIVNDDFTTFITTWERIRLVAGWLYINLTYL